MTNETRCLIKTTCQRKKNLIGHVLRGVGLLKDVLEGRILRKKGQGKSRTGMIDNIMECSFLKMDDLMEGSFVKMKRRAEEE